MTLPWRPWRHKISRYFCQVETAMYPSFKHKLCVSSLTLLGYTPRFYLTSQQDLYIDNTFNKTSSLRSFFLSEEIDSITLRTFFLMSEMTI